MLDFPGNEIWLASILVKEQVYISQIYMEMATL